MQIDFPRNVNYRYFYGFILEKMIAYSNSKSKDDLIINLQRTRFIEPDVICNLLCFFRYHRQHNGSRIFLTFGESSTQLRSYLTDSNFFLHSEQESLFITDILNYFSLSTSKSKSRNTNKISRINVSENPDPYNSDPLPVYVQEQLQLDVFSLFSSSKITGTQRYVKTDAYGFLAGFREIIENSYEHCKNNYCGCYYSFQNYLNSGLNISCCDLGKGYYGSLVDKYLHRDETLSKDEVWAPRLLPVEQFLSFKQNDYRRNLVSILECILYRIEKKIAKSYGFPFIFDQFVLPCNGTIMVHSENTMLRIDREFLNEYFIVRNDKIKGYKSSKLTDLVSDPQKLNELIYKDNLRLFSYCFPGVHITVQIGV